MWEVSVGAGAMETMQAGMMGLSNLHLRLLPLRLRLAEMDDPKAGTDLPLLEQGHLQVQAHLPPDGGI